MRAGRLPLVGSGPDEAGARSAPPSLPPRVSLVGVGKEFTVGAAVVSALVDVDLRIDAGALVVILGPSGSGKTTLLNIIGALDRPTTGTARVGGIDISHATNRQLFDVRRRTVSFIFQTFNLFPALTALENVQFGADVAGRSHPIDVARGELVRVELGQRADHFPSQLSGGEQQRVAIARALATGNEILLADEPTGELDFRTGVQILGLLRAEADAGKTVLVVTHNREIARIADRVIELSNGRIVEDGAPRGGPVPSSELRW